MKPVIKTSVFVIGALATSGIAHASADYGPAIWRPLCQANWYTSGFGHKFHVCHDMEGYYASTVSWFSSCGMTSASVHYAVNGLQDAGSDAAPGEITQLGVTEANYAWHALCWNQHSTGTEHEGFASNPAWYTEAQYLASAGISRHVADKFGYPKDRNHIVGHDEKKNAAWVSYANANLGINATCNSHTDPGANWNWGHYMSLINPVSGSIVDNSSGSFSASAGWATGSSATDKYGGDYRYHSTAASSDPAVWNINFGSAGTHTVYVWYPQGGNRSTTAAYLISTSAGSHTEVVNQQITGGQWVNQGAYAMNAGANTVKLSFWTTTGFIVVADAVQWQ
ncbi:MAG: N-acetylmuramyl-L-alanine amidase, negative regulator of AmpC, AmpD [Verrucomicrobiales bacterium]|nr:N-acetylmuramyl-L-alanine amidase, negative regulator of AmpC, AmpD [Verrucomicrobiales bacterium]